MPAAVIKRPPWEKPYEKAIILNREEPKLIFHAAAWRKIIRATLNRSDELAFYGIALDERNPLYIHDIGIFKQQGHPTYWTADDNAIIEHIQRWAAKGVPIERCARVICHTHPNMKPIPSKTDNEFFNGICATTPWMVMCIISTGMGIYPTPENTLGRLHQQGTVVPSVMDIPVHVDAFATLPPGEPFGEGGWETSVEKDVAELTSKHVEDYRLSSSSNTGKWRSEYDANHLPGETAAEYWQRQLRSSNTERILLPSANVKKRTGRVPKDWPDDGPDQQHELNGWRLNRRKMLYYDRKYDQRRTLIVPRKAQQPELVLQGRDARGKDFDLYTEEEWKDIHNGDLSHLTEAQRSQVAVLGGL